MAKRGRKRKHKRYFDTEEEEALINYLKSDSEAERNYIYEIKLKDPLYKMAESVIKRYQLFSHKLTLEELLCSALSDLHTKLHKFHPIINTNKRIKKIITKKYNEKYNHSFVDFMPKGAIQCTTEDIQKFVDKISNDVSKKCLRALRKLKPPKAYSYFGTVIKHYALGKRIKEHKELERDLSYESRYESIIHDEKFSYEMTIEDSAMKEFFYEYIDIIEDVLESNEDEHILKPNEEKIGYAVVHLMKNWEDVFDDGSHKYNKNQVLECLRNMTNLTTKDIRENLKRFKDLYFERKKEKIDKDYNFNWRSDNKS